MSESSDSSAPASPVTVRDRRSGDLAVLVPLLQRTHEQDGYPVRASAVRETWLAETNELDAAVAVVGGRVVGHVALHPANAEEEPVAVSRWQRAVGGPSTRLAVVSRLFTDRSVPGVGSLLLTEAVRRAERMGRVAVLLVDPDSQALGFYLRRGWQRVGTAAQQWGHRRVEAVLLVQPETKID